MALQPSIILAGQTPDIMGNMARGQQVGQQQNQIQQQNALASLYKTQGAGIAAGDPAALNALAGINPMAAIDVQSNRLGMDAQRQSMTLQAELAKRQAAEYAKGLSAEQRAAEAAQLEQGLSGAAFFYSKGDRQGYEAFLQQNDIDPAQFSFDQFPAHAATMGGVLDVLKGFEPEQPEWRQATPEEAAGYGAQGGQFNTKTGKFDAMNPPKGTRITSDGKGGFTIEEGAGVTGTGDPTIGQTYNPGEVKNVLTMIDEIAANPNLPRVLGPVEGGGGNNIDDLNIFQRGWYGGDGTALVERIGQLQNTAWLAARDMLKGGGAITDYESKKAEGAVARLSRAKSEKEFRTALKDLRDAITEGEAKLRAASGGQTAAPVAQTPPRAEDASLPTGLTADDLQYLELE